MDYEQVEKLAAIHCTDEEIALVLGITSRTIRRHKKVGEVFISAL